MITKGDYQTIVNHKSKKVFGPNGTFDYDDVMQSCENDRTDELVEEIHSKMIIEVNGTFMDNPIRAAAAVEHSDTEMVSRHWREDQYISPANAERGIVKLGEGILFTDIRKSVMQQVRTVVEGK